MSDAINRVIVLSQEAKAGVFCSCFLEIIHQGKVDIILIKCLLPVLDIGIINRGRRDFKGFEILFIILILQRMFVGNKILCKVYILLS